MLKAIRNFFKKEYSSYDELYARYRLLLKSATRCAYDLHHAASACPIKDLKNSRCDKDYNMSTLFYNRANAWLNIFDPDGLKSYRRDLQKEIILLELEINRLKCLCKEAGINYTDPNTLPF
jgi:hypothetical protein